MTTPCPNCKRPVEIPDGFKAVLCAHCGAKVAQPVKVATK